MEAVHYCPHCKRPLGADFEYCPSCGQPQKAGPVLAPHAPPASAPAPTAAKSFGVGSKVCAGLAVGWTALIWIPALISLVQTWTSPQAAQDGAYALGLTIGTTLFLPFVFALWFFPAAVLVILAFVLRR